MIYLENLNEMIENICNLEAGWYDNNQGGTFRKEDFENIKSKLIAANSELGIPFPYIYPRTEENRINLEWDIIGKDYIGFQMDLNIVTGEVEYLDIPCYKDKKFNLDNEWPFIVTALWENLDPQG
jgi:hypothetical protein